jgi:predicted dehydrogenase
MNVIICGLGGIGQRYLRLIKKNFTNSNIYALSSKKNLFEIRDDRSVNKKINLEKKFNIKYINSISDIYRINCKIDFAIICNPTSKHLQVASKLIKKNIPCLIEKPISSNFFEAKIFHNIAKKKKILFRTAFFLRIHPLVLYIKKLIESDYFGKLHSINVVCNSFMPSWNKYSKLSNFYAANKKLGGGILFTECHEIDLLYYILGMPKSIKSFTGRNEKKKYKVNDYCHILMRYQKPDLIANIELNFNQKFLKKEFIVKGSKNVIKLDITNNKILRYNYRYKKFFLLRKSKIERNQLFLNQIKYFIEELKGNKKKKYFDEGINTIKLIENIRLSSL